MLLSLLGGPIFADQAGRVGEIATDLVRRGRAGADWTTRLAVKRAISPNSVTGISLLLSLCAAAWFSGGTRHDDVWGLITAGAWVAVRAEARQLAAVTTQRAGRGAPERRRERSEVPARVRDFGWFYVVCATAADCAIYGGIAAGAQAAGWTASWPLAVAVVIVESVSGVARACGATAAATDPSGRRTTPVVRPLAWLAIPPIGVRVLLAALITVSDTPRIALVVTLTAGVVSLAVNVVKTTGRVATAATHDLVLACRDDGPVARRAGWLVRGNLMPVPPAVAGVVAIGLLAMLGIRSLPGIVALTPVVVLLLAAPGSSHPHDGRFDWLAPVLLCLAQYGYLAALGPAKSVAWPLVFATCSMTAVWYASLAASQARAAPPKTTPGSRRNRVNQIMARRTEGIGWEGRVGIAGVAGMFGIATFGYLGLTVCLGALICGKVATGYLRQEEDQRQ